MAENNLWILIPCFLLVVSMLRVGLSSRLEVYIQMLSLQGLLLFVLIFGAIPHGNYWTMAMAVAETLFLKGFFVPFYLKRMLERNRIVREAEPYLPNLFSLLSMTILIGISFVCAHQLKVAIPELRMPFFGAGIALLCCGLFIILSRKKLITHVMGYCFMENGIFLLSLGAAQEMPVIVSLGVALDAFIWVLLAGILVRLIRSEFPGQSIDQLKGLKH